MTIIGCHGNFTQILKRQTNYFHLQFDLDASRIDIFM